jgi:hypothetical protein
MKRELLVILLFSLGACAYHPALIHTGEDYRIEQEPWSIDALPDGSFLSDDWRAGEDSAKSAKQFVLQFKEIKEDGVLTVVALPLSNIDAKKSLNTLVERNISTLHLLFSKYVVTEEQPVTSVVVDGAEAIETVDSIRRPGDTAPIFRFYLVLFRPFSLSQLFSVAFIGPPGQFEAGVADARNLAHRFHFDSTEIPKSVPLPGSMPKPKPITPAPADPAPPEEPKTSPHHYTPPGAALPG